MIRAWKGKAVRHMATVATVGSVAMHLHSTCLNKELKLRMFAAWHINFQYVLWSWYTRHYVVSAAQVAALCLGCMLTSLRSQL